MERSRSESFAESDRRLERLASLVKGGTSLSAALEAVAPVSEAETRVLRRASFARVFDREMFVRVIGVRGGPTLEQIIGMPGIEPYGLPPDAAPAIYPAPAIYRVKDSVALGYLESWVATDPNRAELRRFSEQVYHYLRERTGYPELEVLRFRLPVESEASDALTRFNELFQEADDSFDLGACHALVHMLQELDNFQADLRTVQLKLLSNAQRQRCDELIPYVTARGRFIEEYAKSATYLQRETLKRKTEEFLAPIGDWLLPVYGRGGSGKTIFLRWLVARHSVPRHIPVAKVDFDDINIGKLSKHPALVLLRFADQLNGQILGAPFNGLLSSYGKYGSILLPSSRIPRGLSVDGLEHELESSSEVESSVRGMFERQLWGKLFVLILDTVEEGVLHFPESLRNVIDLLRSIHEGIPESQRAFRLILSGRYNLAERQFLKASDPIPFEVNPFGDDEALRYLSFRKIGMPDLEPRIVRKARGNPFILSLIADLVSAGDIKDADALESLQFEFAYLIRRVIDRIPISHFGVRWVVRYGVVPRRLTQAFLESVMWPVLREELAAKRHDELKGFADRFQRGEVDESTLWTDLWRYAAPSSWLRATTDDVRFQPEVVTPMRTLLAKEDVHEILHQRARDWFAGKAAEEKSSELWAGWTAEQVYHECWVQARAVSRLVTSQIRQFLINRIADAIQVVGGGPRIPFAQVARLDGTLTLVRQSIVLQLRSFLADSRADSGAARRGLLEAVTGFVETDEEGGAARIEPAVSNVISPELAGWALREWAKSAAGITFGPCRLEEQPANIRNALRLAQIFQPSESPEFLEQLIDMALHVGERNYARAVELGRTTLSALAPGTRSQKAPTVPEFYCATLLLARALAGIDDAGAEAQYEAAFEVLQHQVHPGWPAFELLAESGRELARMGKPDRALFAFRWALSAAAPHEDRLLPEVAELCLDTGDYTNALQLAEQIPPISNFQRDRVQRLAFTARLELERAVPRSLPPSASPLDLETEGIVNAAWWNLYTAEQQLEAAVSMHRSVGDARRVQSSLLALVRLLKDQMGNWNRAERILESSTTKSPALDLELVELKLLKGATPHPQSEFGRAFAELYDGADARPGLERLLGALEAVGPVEARYQYLRMFRYLPEFEGVADLERRFWRAVPLPTAGSSDFFARVFDYIELLRSLKASSAANLLHTAINASPAGLTVHAGLAAAAAGRLHIELPPMDQSFVSDQSPTVRTVIAVQLESAQIGRVGRVNFDKLKGGIPSEMEELHGTLVEVEYLKIQAQYHPSGESRRNYIETAAKFLRSLGQDGAARRLLASLSARSLAIASAAKDRLVIALDSVPDPWDARSQPGIPIEHVTALLGEQTQATRALRAALPENTRGKLVVELDVDNAPLASLPWEWAFPENVVCFRNSSALRRKLRSPNRLSMSNMLLVVRRLIPSFSPVRVTILRQPIAYQEQTRRGFDLMSRQPLTTIYRSHGAQVHEPERLEKKAIEEAFEVFRPNVIHIQAPVNQYEGLFVLDLPLAVGSEEAPRLFTANYLSQLFRQLPNRNPPLLVLDPPGSPDDAEVAQQLLLRNHFASEFVALGNAGAVLCTGLFDREGMQLAAERLAQEISRTRRLDQLLMLCRQELTTNRFSGLGAALFAPDPKELLR
jgi:hypothetical protein